MNNAQMESARNGKNKPLGAARNKGALFLLLPALVILLCLAAIIGRQYYDAVHPILKSDVLDNGILLGEIRNKGTFLAEKDGISIYLADGVLSVIAPRGSNTAPDFLLYVFPEDISVLPQDRQVKGFENLHFNFAKNLAFTEADTGENIAQVSLKSLQYKPVSLAIGQYNDKGNIWKITVDVSTI